MVKKVLIMLLGGALVVGLSLLALAVGEVELHKLNASDAVIGDCFGYAVALSGSKALVGAWGNDDAGSISGSAYLYDFSDLCNITETKLTASDAASGDCFGWSVALNGTTALVAAYLDDDADANCGSAYLYDFSDPCNIIETKLTASDAAAGDWFGHAVALSGYTALVGAPRDDDAGSKSGSAYLYDFSDPCNIIETKLTASDAATMDYFGYAVALSGSKALVGAILKDDSSGSAYLFDFSDPCNIIETKLTDSNAASMDYFGCAVALSGSTALVGARFDDEAGPYSSSGSAFLFDISDPCNITETKLVASDADSGDCFGCAVAISGSTALVGARYDDDAGDKSGSAYLYDFSDLCSITETKLTASDAAAMDYFGYAVALSGSTALVGAHGVNDGGAAYIFGPELVLVDIDIKPASCPNPFSVYSYGILQVAILGTEEFGVSEIDVASVRLNGVAPVRHNYEDVSTPVADANDCNCTAEGADGYVDLIVRFESEDIVDTLADVNDGDVVELGVTGVLTDETPIEGSDCIVIQGRHKPMNRGDINKDGMVNMIDLAVVADNWLEEI